MLRSREASVGLLIFAAGLVLMVGIMAVGKESRLFARKVEYWASFPNVSGLAEGSPGVLVIQLRPEESHDGITAAVSV